MCIFVHLANIVHQVSFIRFSEMPQPKWTKESSERYWEQRPSRVILRSTNIRHLNETRAGRRSERLCKRATRKEEFLRAFRVPTWSTRSKRVFTDIANDLRFWAEHGSWAYCTCCGSLQSKKLLPAYRKRTKPASSKSCTCSTGRYQVPHARRVPAVLQNLTMDEIYSLCPFRAFSGRYTRMMFGYRMREEPFKPFKWAQDDVEVKIRHIADPVSRRRTRAAFDYLMNKPNCSYKKFILMHCSHVSEPRIFELFSHKSFHGVEAALWPNLYHQNSLCESFLEGQETRTSGKVSFMTKIASAVSDYAMHYDLLHYHYDRWLFKTITGAINSAKQAQCSPATALEAKTFSHQYWTNQHRYLMDAVRQFGFPSMFITISPFEWTFPFPPWLEHIRNQTGKGVTELAIPETIHIAHVPEQYIQGYLCGSTTNRWKNHLFAKKSDPSANNVTNYFYRFEFQKRGTLHAHILIWLEDMNDMDVTKLSATIPWGNVEEAFLVYDLQKSRTSCLPLRQAPNRVLTENNETYLAFHHTRTDKGCNLRAFVPAVTGSLQCSMDVQSSDGKAMLLKYVTSYVAKCHDEVKTQQLYSMDLGAYQAATSFLKNMHPLEPEVVLQLTSMKIAWSNSRTKPFTAPTPSQTQHKVHQKYLARSEDDEHLTFLEWLRHHDHEKNPPKCYEDGSTLVGVKHFSVFNRVFFYQLLIMNLPHRTLDELHDLREDPLPEPIKHLVQAREKLPNILGSRETILQCLSSESHKRSYLDTNLLCYTCNLCKISTRCGNWELSTTRLQHLNVPSLRCNILSPHSGQPSTPDTFLLWRQAVRSAAHGHLEAVPLRTN